MEIQSAPIKINDLASLLKSPMKKKIKQSKINQSANKIIFSSSSQLSVTSEINNSFKEKEINRQFDSPRDQDKIEIEVA